MEGRDDLFRQTRPCCWQVSKRRLPQRPQHTDLRFKPFDLLVYLGRMKRVVSTPPDLRKFPAQVVLGLCCDMPLPHLALEGLASRPTRSRSSINDTS